MSSFIIVIIFGLITVFIVRKFGGVSIKVMQSHCKCKGKEDVVGNISGLHWPYWTIALTTCLKVVVSFFHQNPLRIRTIWEETDFIIWESPEKYQSLFWIQSGTSLNLLYSISHLTYLTSNATFCCCYTFLPNIISHFVTCNFFSHIYA